jgi:serine/threonine protein phosphatase 1
MGRLLAISDIHGCFDPFYRLVTDKINLNKSDKLILLGDYVDRGEKSKEVIDFIIDLINRGFDVTPLCGNHESMLVDSWKDPNMLPLWLINDGIITLYSFGIQDIEQLDKRYLDFFTNLRFYEIVDDYLFVHAGFNDNAEDPFADIHGMIWESRPSYKNPLLSGKTIIHGHRPKTLDFIESMINQKSGVIPIDSGCVYEKESGYGKLSALDVTNMELISIENF